MEKISYGSIRQFWNAKDIRRFYARLGILPRLESGEITSVARIYMNPEDHETLRLLLSERAVSKRPDLQPDKVRFTAGMDWLNLAPQSDENVPKGELWICK